MSQAAANPSSHAQKPTGAPAWLPIGAAALLAAYAAHVWRFAYVNDDAYISFRYARNLARGIGLRYNASEQPPVEGYSNFLWTVLAAPVIGTGFDPAVVMPMLSALCGGCLLWMVYARLARDSGPVAALAGAGLLAALPPFALWATSGLETMPFALALYLSLDRLVLRAGGPDGRLGGVCLLLLALLRVEGAAWAVVLLTIALLWAVLRRGRGLREVIAAAAVFALTYAVYSGWRWSYFGTLIPSTVLAKSALDGPRLVRGVHYVVSFVLTFWVPLVLLPGLLAALRRERRAAALTCAALALGLAAYSVLVTGDFMPMGRFLLPALAPLALLWGWALGDLARWRRAIGTALACAAGVSAAVVAALPGFGVHMTPRATLERFRFRFNEPQFATEIEAFQRQVERAGNWRLLGEGLRQFVQERGTSEAASVVLPWIGAAGYYSDLHVYDQYGLISPTVARREVAQDERLASPGHDKFVPPTFFLDERPTVLNAVLWSGLPARRAAGAAAQFARALMALEPRGKIAAAYAPDMMEFGERAIGANAPQHVLAVWVRLPDAVTPARAWRDFEERLEEFARTGTIRGPVWQGSDP